MTSFFVDPRLKGELGSYNEKVFQDDGWALVLNSSDFERVDPGHDSILFVTGVCVLAIPLHMIFMRKTMRKRQVQ